MNKDELKQIILECNKSFLLAMKCFDKMINSCNEIGPEVQEKLQECFTYAKSVINHTAFQHGEITGKELKPDEPSDESPVQTQ